MIMKWFRRRKMSKKALVIGINNYMGKNRLNCCINDAIAISERLKQDYNGDPNFTVNTILVEDITKAIPNSIASLTASELKKNVEKLFSNNDDIALLYFSGHGYTDDYGEYIVGTDFSEHSLGLKLDEVWKIIEGSKCKNKIVILDSCFSGGMGNIPLFSNDKAVLGKGVTILSASREDEPSKTDGDYSLFTRLLLQALDGGAADLVGNITLGSIYSYVDKALGEWEQRPLFKTNVQEFISLRKTKPSIEKKDLRKLKDIFDDTYEKKLDPSFEFTNDPSRKELHMEYVEPYSNPENVKIFKLLQKYEGVGLVVPVGEEHMYYAAMHSKSCKLTPLGEYYYYLSKKGRI